MFLPKSYNIDMKVYKSHHKYIIYGNEHGLYIYSYNIYVIGTSVQNLTKNEDKISSYECKFDGAISYVCDFNLGSNLND